MLETKIISNQTTQFKIEIEDVLPQRFNLAFVNHSGIWNTSYLIDQNNVDNYPLALQVDISALAPTLTTKPIQPSTLPILSMAIIVAILAVAAWFGGLPNANSA